VTLKIEFSSPLKGFIPEPQPALRFVPEEYKKMSRYVGLRSDDNKTVKMCVPFLDSYTTGYIIPFPTDINCFYDQEKQKMNFEINSNMPTQFSHLFNVSGHNNHQISNELRSNKRSIEAVFKFINSWHIKTPKGYSCIFTTPFNHNFPFELIDGIVDTDSHPLSVNLPFYWTLDVSQTFIIQKGSPMVQIIPFKRDDWSSNIKPGSFEKNTEKGLKWSTVFEDVYKKFFWKKKSFK